MGIQWMVHWWVLVHCGHVMEHPKMHHHPLETLCDSVVDEPQL
jgi:hypothetical protein